LPPPGQLRYPIQPAQQQTDATSAAALAGTQPSTLVAGTVDAATAAAAGACRPSLAAAAAASKRGTAATATPTVASARPFQLAAGAAALTCPVTHAASVAAATATGASTRVRRPSLATAAAASGASKRGKAAGRGARAATKKKRSQVPVGQLLTGIDEDKVVYRDYKDFVVDHDDAVATASQFNMHGVVIFDLGAEQRRQIEENGQNAAIVAEKTGVPIFQTGRQGSDGYFEMLCDPKVTGKGKRLQLVINDTAAFLAAAARAGVNEDDALKVLALAHDTIDFVTSTAHPALQPVWYYLRADDNAPLCKFGVTLIANDPACPPAAQAPHCDTLFGDGAEIYLIPLRGSPCFYFTPGSHHWAVDARRRVYAHHKRNGTLLGQDGGERPWVDLIKDEGAAKVLNTMARTAPAHKVVKINLPPGFVLCMHGSLMHSGGEGKMGDSEARMHVYLVREDAIEADPTDQQGYTYPMQMLLDLAYQLGVKDPATVDSTVATDSAMAFADAPRVTAANGAACINKASAWTDTAGIGKRRAAAIMTEDRAAVGTQARKRAHVASDIVAAPHTAPALAVSVYQ
jgi:Phytanoyl-CoA dioxygenase (PhyH)